MSKEVTEDNQENTAKPPAPSPSGQGSRPPPGPPGDICRTSATQVHPGLRAREGTAANIRTPKAVSSQTKSTERTGKGPLHIFNARTAEGQKTERRRERPPRQSLLVRGCRQIPRTAAIKRTRSSLAARTSKGRGERNGHLEPTFMCPVEIVAPSLMAIRKSKW